MLLQPFRGSRAVAAGLVTANHLRGPRFERLFPDIYVAADLEIDFEVLSRAAYLLVAGQGVLCGYSAAELLGASCGPAGGPTEVLVRGNRKALSRLRVFKGEVGRDEVMRLGDVWLTTPLRTAFDLACRGTLVEAVIALDALGHHRQVDPWDVVRFGSRHPGVRGRAGLPAAARLADRRAESPMETRLRLIIGFAGLPPPELQHPVGPYRLDLAYPSLRLGIEYDGREHLTPERARSDLARENAIGRAGWTVVRYKAAEILGSPEQIVEEIARSWVRSGGTAAARRCPGSAATRTRTAATPARRPAPPPRADRTRGRWPSCTSDTSLVDT